jgi:hypothetical protein
MDTPVTNVKLNCVKRLGGLLNKRDMTSIPVNTTKMYTESGGRVPYILDLSFMLWCFSPQRKRLWCAQDRRLGGLQQWQGEPWSSNM